MSLIYWALSGCHQQLQQFYEVKKARRCQLLKKWFVYCLKILLILAKKKYFIIVSMQTADNLPELIKKMKQTEKEVKDAQSQNQSPICSFCVGLTGAGKSTLISCLCGAKIDSKQVYGEYEISHKSPQLPEIGNTMTSCTTIPKFYHATNRQVLNDAPGFLATNGEIQQILDAYCNAKMFKIGRKARIIIVVEYNTIFSSRAGGLFDFAIKLRELFGCYFKDIINSCMLVVTKADLTRDPLTNVRGKLDNISNAVIKLEPEAKDLIRALLKYNRIKVFPIPPQINDGIVEEILSSISNLEGYPIISQPNVVLTGDARIVFENLIKHLEQEKQRQIQCLSQEVYKTFKPLENVNDKEQLNQALLKIKSARQMVEGGELQSGIPEKIIKFQELLSVKQEFIDKLIDWASQLQFCLTIDPQMNFSYNEKSILIKTLIVIEGELEKRLKQLTTQEEFQKMKSSHQQAINNQAANFQSQINQANAQAIARQQKLKKDAEIQNKKFQDRIEGEKNNLKSQLTTQTKKNEQLLKGMIQQTKNNTKLRQEMKRQNEKIISRLQGQVSALKSQKPKVIERVIVQRTQTRCQIM